MRTKTISAAIAATVVAAALVPSAAEASNASLRVAVQRADKKIYETPALKSAISELSRGAKASVSGSSAGKAENLLAKELTALEAAKRDVGAQKGTTQASEEGRTVWLEAAGKLMDGYRDYLDAATDFKKGSSSAAAAKAKSGAARLKGGFLEQHRGEVLLKVRNPGRAGE
jgi:hypothetical protein